MNDESEENMQRRFDAWRDQEASQTPDLDRVWQRARRHAARAGAASAPRLGLRFAAAGAVALITATMVWLALPNAEPTNEITHIDDWDVLLAPLAEDLAIPEPPAWVAPTDYLLAASTEPFDQP